MKKRREGTHNWEKWKEEDDSAKFTAFTDPLPFIVDISEHLTLRGLVAQFIASRQIFFSPDLLPEELVREIEQCKQRWDSANCARRLKISQNGLSISTGSLVTVWDGSANWASVRATKQVEPPTDKRQQFYYWEVKIDRKATEDLLSREAVWSGIVYSETKFSVLNDPHIKNCFLGDNKGQGYYSKGALYPAVTRLSDDSDHVPPLQEGDVIGHLVDFNKDRLYFYKNGSRIPYTYIIRGYPFWPAVSIWGRAQVTANFYPNQLPSNLPGPGNEVDEEVSDLFYAEERTGSFLWHSSTTE